MEIPKMKDATWIKGVEEAVKALAMPAGERSQLIVFLEADPVGDDENGMGKELYRILLQTCTGSFAGLVSESRQS